MSTLAAKAISAPVDKRLFLAAQWRWLALFNYAVDPQILAPLVPRGTELDFDDVGKTYVSLVGFLFRDTRLFGWSIPGHRHFEELNLRFYVRREEQGELRRGVVFVKELVPLVAVTTVARYFYNESYETAPMRHVVTEESEAAGPAATYEFAFRGEWNCLAMACHAGASLPALDSHEAFVLEHYFGYTRQRDGGTLEYFVEHPRWNAWQASEVDIDCNFAAVYGQEFGETLSRQPDSAFLADGSAVTVARPRRIA